VVREQERARVLGALASVDAVVLFDETTPLHLIKAIRPDVLVKGGDYTEDQVVGSAEVHSWGGKVTLVPLMEGQSTTEVIRRAALQTQ
jgi:D-beta-D-heptose 7-phosphate kinase/D-beta-D-heptose 1-phosphate adenosyltransferase